MMMEKMNARLGGALKNIIPNRLQKRLQIRFTGNSRYGFQIQRKACFTLREIQGEFFHWSRPEKF